MPVARVLVDGMPGDMVSVADRGFSYGDGLFETIRFVGGRAPLWARHMQRLQDSSARLRMPAPDVAQLWEEAAAVTQGMDDAVVRLTLTRGIGQRGYAPPASPVGTRVVAAFDMPSISPDVYVQGIRMRWCETRWAPQPLLAGMKHLNRLEQVMARAEWSDPDIADGVVLDLDGHVISATMANLFAVIDGVLVTPSLDRCGVAGVARAEVITTRPGTQLVEMSPSHLRQASEVFLSSSVRGILPVQAVGDTLYVPGPVTRALQQHWRGLGFPMEQA